jgi:hypothetical protein
MMLCESEHEVVERCIAGTLDDALHQHVTSCHACAETFMVVEALQRDASSSIREIVLPSRDLVVWKARLHTQREKTKAATRPINVAFLVAAVCSVVSATAYGALSGAFSRITAIPLALSAGILAAALVTAAPFCLWKIGE